MKTGAYFLSYPAQLFLEWKMFQTNVEEIPTHILCSIKFILKSCLSWDNVKK
jgi:hypothetical protein